jgi:hypothetical protein
MARVDPAVLEAIRQQAARERRTIMVVIDIALREYLERYRTDNLKQDA